MISLKDIYNEAMNSPLPPPIPLPYGAPSSQSRQEQPISAPPENVISVTYPSTRADHWRCNLRVLLLQKLVLIYFIAFPLYIGFSASHRRYGAFSLTTFAVTSGVAFFGMLLIQVLTLWLQIKKRLPRADSVRVCTSSLTPQGFHDITPQKAALATWTKITAIRQHDGDIFISCGLANGCFIPRSAFASREEVTAFFDIATALWKSKGANWDMLYSSWPQSKIEPKVASAGAI